MSEILEFDAVLNAVPGNDALYIDFPYDVQEIYGVKGQVKILATYDGVPYRGSMVKMGGPCHILLVRIDIRKQIGKNPGDTVHVTVQRDTEPRIVEVPEDLEVDFEHNPAAKQFYETLSFTNRKEYARWVDEAKRPETRANRVALSIEKLLGGKKNPSEK